MKQPLALQDLLRTGHIVQVRINTSHESKGDIELVIPEYLKKDAEVVLEIGYNTAIPIPDLELESNGVSCTLSFNRTPQYCFIPWESITGYGGDAVTALLEELQKGKAKEDEPKLQQSTPKKSSSGRVIRPDWLRVIK